LALRFLPDLGEERLFVLDQVIFLRAELRMWFFALAP